MGIRSMQILLDERKTLLILSYFNSDGVLIRKFTRSISFNNKMRAIYLRYNVDLCKNLFCYICRRFDECVVSQVL